MIKKDFTYLLRKFAESELILNSDGSIFHLHLQPEQLADTVILVGDPDRVPKVANYFESIECEVNNREFRTITGLYKGKRISVISTGIGTDNIDIVLNELDALVNIDLKNRIELEKKKSLTIVRIGTSGSLQEDIPVGSFVIAEKSIGFDGVLTFYSGRNEACNLEFESELLRQLRWNPQLASPYVIEANAGLVDKIGNNEMIKGVTISANGFYGPQGRQLRLKLYDPQLNERIEKFEFNGRKITNYEMESSAIAGLSKLMGHKAMTVCCIIANRRDTSANTDYQPFIEKLIQTVLDRI